MNHAVYSKLCGSSDHDQAYRAFHVGECQLPEGTIPAPWRVRGYDNSLELERGVSVRRRKAVERHRNNLVRRHGRNKPIGCGVALGRHDTCGSYRGGRMVLCDGCYALAAALYPQGWRGYPGDTCEHGRYVGGCGADLICPACEFGED